MLNKSTSKILIYGEKYTGRNVLAELLDGVVTSSIDGIENADILILETKELSFLKERYQLEDFIKIFLYCSKETRQERALLSNDNSQLNETIIPTESECDYILSTSNTNNIKEFVALIKILKIKDIWRIIEWSSILTTAHVVKC